MNEDEESGFPILVSVIAVCGFAVLTALTAPLWVGPAQDLAPNAGKVAANSPIGREGWHSIASDFSGPLGQTRRSKPRSCNAFKRWRR